MSLRWKPAETPENFIFVALMSTVAIGAARVVLDAFEVFGSKAMTEALAFAACIWMFPREERARWSAKLVMTLVALGLVGGAAWVALVAYPARNESTLLTWDQIPLANYLLGVVTSCVVAPLYEEKVVRHLLQSGASHYLGKILGTFAVCALFAAAHTEAVLSSFLFGLYVTLGIFLFRLDTYQRAIIHGMVNFVIMHWVIIYPNIQ
ncbi:type II CAAX prenyl endopeptidase Rce1 family protein [Stenotrophomonas sp. CFBP8980]|uniref:CPBP family glutamic-type intramembrane protease n=1 Tax=Stenotrophomonas sp. CFBP8980 TaxID=3096523 RepID=UPI002A6B21FD|nr:CPBP family glutamic-type intramembrane protease [Stenotrophomonas sp. CFBP8980]MDY1034698.1 CPBP family glutamic-type intramembrane protease [Stenotrophomonas sp. CFBP8980]